MKRVRFICYSNPSLEKKKYFKREIFLKKDNTICSKISKEKKKTKKKQNHINNCNKKNKYL